MADTDLTGLSEINALLGAGTEYEGKLVFQGRVRIDGRFVGEIRGSDVLILGATAEVNANVDVGALIVLGGTLRGDVVARRLVELHAPGAVHGDIETPQLFIDKGATFTGKCSMGAGPSEVLPMEAESNTALPHDEAATSADDDTNAAAGPTASQDGQSQAPADAGSGTEGDAGSGAHTADAEHGDEDDAPFVRAPSDDESDEPDQRRVPRT